MTKVIRTQVCSNAQLQYYRSNYSICFCDPPEQGRKVTACQLLNYKNFLTSFLTKASLRYFVSVWEKNFRLFSTKCFSVFIYSDNNVLMDAWMTQNYSNVTEPFGPTLSLKPEDLNSQFIFETADGKLVDFSEFNDSTKLVRIQFGLQGAVLAQTHCT